jgi:rRNA-processing protein FCF1
MKKMDLETSISHRLSYKLMKEVVFDSSFLLSISEKPTDWERQFTEILGAYTPVILSSVEEELNVIASHKGKRAMMARAALEIAKKFKRFEIKGKADATIVYYCDSFDAAAATTDKELAEKLIRKKKCVFSIKDGRIYILTKKRRDKG